MAQEGKETARFTKMRMRKLRPNIYRVLMKVEPAVTIGKPQTMRLVKSSRFNWLLGTYQESLTGDSMIPSTSHWTMAMS